MDSHSSDLEALRKSIEQTHSLEDLKGLAFNLSINYDQLDEGGLIAKVTSLIQHVCRRDKLADLKEQLIKDPERDHVAWEEINWSVICDILDGEDVDPVPPPASTARGFGDFFYQIVIGVLVSMIVSWIISIFSNPISLQIIIAILEITMLIFTPLIIREVLSRFAIDVLRRNITMLSICFIVIEVLLFSAISGGNIPVDLTIFPPKGDKLQALFPNGKIIDGDNKIVKIQRDKEGIVKKGAGQFDELHLLADVEWTRKEDNDRLVRNYAGQLYFVYEYKCDLSTGKLNFNSGQMAGISFKAGSGVLSWMIGFAETPFLYLDETVSREFENVVKEELLVCE